MYPECLSYAYGGENWCFLFDNQAADAEVPAVTWIMTYYDVACTLSPSSTINHPTVSSSQTTSNKLPSTTAPTTLKTMTTTSVVQPWTTLTYTPLCNKQGSYNENTKLELLNCSSPATGQALCEEIYPACLAYAVVGDACFLYPDGAAQVYTAAGFSSYTATYYDINCKVATATSAMISTATSSASPKPTLKVRRRDNHTFVGFLRSVFRRMIF
jgi:hypothetical protein